MRTTLATLPIQRVSPRSANMARAKQLSSAKSKLGQPAAHRSKIGVDLPKYAL
jgi:hypothetical protein